MPASLVQLVVAGEGDSGGDQSAAQVGQGDVVKDHENSPGVITGIPHPAHGR